VTEKTIGRRRMFSGRLLTLDVEDVQLDDGQVTTREIVGHPGAAAVLAQDEHGRFVFVRQYRKPVDAELVEIVAGVLRQGEAPGRCARRELAEETGMRAVSLVRLGIIHPSPGYTREVLHIFFAKALPGATGARPDHDERIAVVFMDRRQVERAIGRGAIRDAKTLAAWSLYLLAPGLGGGRARS